jgi:hypothetical protein
MLEDMDAFLADTRDTPTETADKSTSTTEFATTSSVGDTNTSAASTFTLSPSTRTLYAIGEPKGRSRSVRPDSCIVSRE